MTLSRLAEGMQARGHQLQVVRPRLPADYDLGCDDLPLPHTIRRPGFTLPNYPELRIGMPSFTILQAAWRQRRPDVVHIATEGPMGLSALLAARRLGIPCTSSFHTNFDQYTDHYHFGFLRHTVAAYLRWMHNRSFCTMVPTVKQARDLSAEGYQRVRILSRGLDDMLFHPGRRSKELRKSWQAGPETLVLTVVGRVAAEKNLQLAIDTFQAVRAQRPDSKLVIVGDGPERSRFSGIDGVIMAGMRCGTELATYYASADLFLFPSLTETYGNVLVEAMASGLPAVAFDYAAAAELIDNGANGVVAAFGDRQAFIDAACRISRDDDRRRRMGVHAIAVTRSRRWSSVVDSFQKHLAEAIASRPATTR